MTLRRLIQFLYLSVLDIRSRLFINRSVQKVNLCCGNQKVASYAGVDFDLKADIVINLNWGTLPFASNSIKVVTCISGINYFTRKRGEELIKEVHRILEKGGIARFASQDLELIAHLYVTKDTEFFFQKGFDGADRFEGKTRADKINKWFYGYETFAGSCRYFYDYETLEDVFKCAGFKNVKQKKFLDSCISEVCSLDNRPDQMFFLEAIK